MKRLAWALPLVLVLALCGAGPKGCRGGPKACPPMPAPTPTASATPASTPSPTFTLGMHWPHVQPKPTVALFYAGQGFSPAVVSAFQRAAAVWNDTGYVNVVPQGEMQAPDICGGVAHIIAACSLTADGPWEQTGTAPVYTDLAHITAVGIWVRSDIDAVAATNAALLAGALNPRGGIGWTAQDWLDMAACHELGHAIGLDHSTGNSCMVGSSACPGEADRAGLALLYSHRDAWDWGGSGTGPTGGGC